MNCLKKNIELTKRFRKVGEGVLQTHGDFVQDGAGLVKREWCVFKDQNGEGELQRGGHDEKAKDAKNRRVERRGESSTMWGADHAGKTDWWSSDGRCTWCSNDCRSWEVRTRARLWWSRQAGKNNQNWNRWGKRGKSLRGNPGSLRSMPKKVVGETGKGFDAKDEKDSYNEHIFVRFLVYEERKPTP